MPPDGRLLRIQVKSGRVRDGCVRFNTYSTDHGSGARTYEGRADVIAVIDPPRSTQMQLAIIADTHMPKGGRRLPDDCIACLTAADLIIHAGDLSDLAVLSELESYGSVIAVHGNVDSPEVRARLPETAQVQAGGATLAVIHDAGPARGRIERLRRRFPDADAVVFGHSHLPVHERAPDGFQIFNPGSPTERRRSPHHTMGVATVQARKPAFELVVLG